MDAVSQQDLERIQQAGGADLVVGILGPDHNGEAGAAVAIVRAALGELSGPSNRVVRAVVLSNNGAPSPAATVPEGDGSTGSSTVLWFNLAATDPEETPQSGIAHAYRSVLAVGGKLGARACGVIASHLQ